MINNPDGEFLLKLLRAEPVSCGTPEQWHAVVRLARRQGIALLLYRQLKILGITEQVPPDLLQELRSAYKHTAILNLRMYQRLKVMFERFQRAGILAILLKGAYLADAIYGNVAARPMGDVDLLVKKNDLARADGIMQEMDFNRTDTLTELVKEYHSFGYELANNGLRVDLHWNLIDSINHIHVDMEALWERSRVQLVANIPVNAMSPEDQILYLCLHASHHIFELGLRPICDLYETLHHYQETLNWEGLRQRAQLWNAERCLYVNLRIAKELLNATVADDWLNANVPAGFEQRYLTLAREHLFSTFENQKKALPSEANLVDFWTADSMAKKMAFLWKSFFPERQILAMDYHIPPDSLRIFLYYLVHLKDLLQRHGRLGWKLLRGDKQTVDRAKRQKEVNALKSWLLLE